MIKATIQNNPYCTEMTFPCTETELLKNLGELGIDKDHLAPTGMIIDIEPAELSILLDCEVSLDALNYLGKRMDGMERLEEKQFLAVLSCDELNMNWGLKKIISGKGSAEYSERKRGRFPPNAPRYQAERVESRQNGFPKGAKIWLTNMVSISYPRMGIKMEFIQLRNGRG